MIAQSCSTLMTAAVVAASSGANQASFSHALQDHHFPRTLRCHRSFGSHTHQLFVLDHSRQDLLLPTSSCFCMDLSSFQVVDELS